MIFSVYIHEKYTRKNARAYTEVSPEPIPGSIREIKKKKALFVLFSLNWVKIMFGSFICSCVLLLCIGVQRFCAHAFAVREWIFRVVVERPGAKTTFMAN